MKFYFRYVKKISIPQRSSFFEKGKKIHALANYFLCGNDISKMEEILTEDEKTLWKKLKNSDFFKLQKVETEYNLSCKVGEYWVGGRLDALMKDENKNYTILDYKTGSIPKNPETDFQTMVYLLSAGKFLSKKDGYTTLKFVYIDLKNSTSKEIIFTEARKKEYEDKIISACKKINFAIESTVFEPSKNCERCEFKKICKKEQ